MCTIKDNMCLSVYPVTRQAIEDQLRINTVIIYKTMDSLCNVASSNVIYEMCCIKYNNAYMHFYI